MKKGIYVREGTEYVGPFHSSADAEVFLRLMQLHGESLTGIEIVKVSDLGETGETTITTVEERSTLLSRKIEPAGTPEAQEEIDRLLAILKHAPNGSKRRKSN